LKEKLHQLFPNIHKTKAGPDTVRRCLAEALDVVWTQDIAGDLLESLWESMPRRVAAVLDTKGLYTKYCFFFSKVLDGSFLISTGYVHRFSVHSKQLWLYRE